MAGSRGDPARQASGASKAPRRRADRSPPRLGRTRPRPGQAPTARSGSSFPARPASAAPVALTVSDASGGTTVSDILVGDVWLCSGQSNMAFTVSAGLNGYNNIQASADPLLRMLTVPLDTAAKPVREFGGKVAWQSASPGTTGGFSARVLLHAARPARRARYPDGRGPFELGGSQIRAWLTPEGRQGTLWRRPDGAARPVHHGPPRRRHARSRRSGRPGGASRPGPSRGRILRRSPGSRCRRSRRGAPGPIRRWRRTASATCCCARPSTSPPNRSAPAARSASASSTTSTPPGSTDTPVGITHGWSAERNYRVPASFLEAGPERDPRRRLQQLGLRAASRARPTGLFFDVEGGAHIPLGNGWQFADGQADRHAARARRGTPMPASA